MNIVSFADELVKVGGLRCLYKRAADIDSGDIPAGMMDPSAAPPHHRVVPDEAATRLEGSGAGTIAPGGTLGSVAIAAHPIDRERFNRPFVERR